MLIIKAPNSPVRVTYIYHVAANKAATWAKATKNTGFRWLLSFYAVSRGMMW